MLCLQYNYIIIIYDRYNVYNYIIQAGAMLTMTHSTSLRASPQVKLSELWNFLSVLQIVCLIILEREKCILFIRSEIIDFMVNFRQVPPTSQTRTYLASPMDWMPLGNSCLIPHPPKKNILILLIVPPFFFTTLLKLIYNMCNPAWTARNAKTAT